MFTGIGNSEILPGRSGPAPNHRPSIGPDTGTGPQPADRSTGAFSEALVRRKGPEAAASPRQGADAEDISTPAESNAEAVNVLFGTLELPGLSRPDPSKPAIAILQGRAVAADGINQQEPATPADDPALSARPLNPSLPGLTGKTPEQNLVSARTAEDKAVPGAASAVKVAEMNSDSAKTLKTPVPDGLQPVRPVNPALTNSVAGAVVAQFSAVAGAGTPKDGQQSKQPGELTFVQPLSPAATAPTSASAAIPVDTAAAGSAPFVPPAVSAEATQTPGIIDLGQEEWAKNLALTLSGRLTRDGQKVEFVLHPERLGRMQVHLEIENTTARVHFVTATEEAAKLMDSHASLLSENLARSGLQLGGHSSHRQDDEAETESGGSGHTPASEDDIKDDRRRDQDRGQIDLIA